jgi:hypothetical protein
MMKSETMEWLSFIAKVAHEQDFEIRGKGANKRLYIDKHHAVAFELKTNRVGFLQAHQWETDATGASEGRYGRAVYSIRSYSDVAQFCSILLASSNLRAKRRGES